MAYDPDNIFAKILRGEAPAYTVFEDEHTLAFMDVMPQTPGHTLVIPKAPAENLFELPADFLQGTLATTQRIARAVKTAFDAEGIMIAQLNGAAAGQTVFHLHFHVIPRSGDVDMTMHAREMAPPELLAEHAERVRDAL
ncbi:MAG: HIT family protein [Pseudomonadota bacterium]